jgi:hypothetical protein
MATKITANGTQRSMGSLMADLIMMRKLVEPVVSPGGGRGIGRRQLDTGASAVIAGRGGDRILQRDDETIEAFEARVKALVSAAD